jgi:hypothetical protein
VTCGVSDKHGSFCSWTDGSVEYLLGKRTTTDMLNHSIEGDFETGRVHLAGTSAAVWKIGPNVFCKVKAWREGMQLESNTIRFVKEKVPQIPLPEIVGEWVDRAWNRTFLLLRRVEGQTLQDAWPKLSALQHQKVADIVSNYCAKLALVTSERFSTVNGAGVYEYFLNTDSDKWEPSWKPRLIGPYTIPEIATYLTNSSSNKFPEIGNDLHLYHADLGPTNILVAKDGQDIRVTGVIDWESAAFYPKFWIATKPKVSAGFYLGENNDYTGNRQAWIAVLCHSLNALGFMDEVEKFKAWMAARHNQ